MIRPANAAPGRVAGRIAPALKDVHVPAPGPGRVLHGKRALRCDEGPDLQMESSRDYPGGANAIARIIVSEGERKESKFRVRGCEKGSPGIAALTTREP